MTGPNGKRRVVVTGMGVVAPTGIGVSEFWTNMRNGTCAIGPITQFPLQDLYIHIAAEVKDFNPQKHGLSKMLLLSDRYSQFAGAAAYEAMAQAGFDGKVPDGERAACVIGSGIGGLGTLEKGYEDLFIHKKPATHPLTLLRTIGSSAAAHVSIDFGLRGPCFGTVSACSTAAHAVGLKLMMIRTGMAFGMVPAEGGVDAAQYNGCFRECPAQFSNSFLNPRVPIGHHGGDQDEIRFYQGCQILPEPLRQNSVSGKVSGDV